MQRTNGRFTVDLFATRENRKVAKYYSLFAEAESTGVEALSQDWTGENAWIAAPVALALMAAKKVGRTRMTRVLVVPMWPHGKFWNFFFPDGAHACWMVREMKTERTKMDHPGDSSEQNLLTSQYHQYLILYMRGGEKEPWRPRIEANFCIKKLFNKQCPCPEKSK